MFGEFAAYVNSPPLPTPAAPAGTSPPFQPPLPALEPERPAEEVARQLGGRPRPAGPQDRVPEAARRRRIERVAAGEPGPHHVSRIRCVGPDGTWLIVDVNGMPKPEENHDHPLGGLLYALSVLDCLACSTSEDDGAALGTLGLPEPVARRMTAEAGFTRFTVRDFGNPLNSFYEVRP
jgi:hypothetical protein